MRISDWSSDVCSSDLIASTVRTGWTEMSSRNENLLDELTVRMADERAAYVGRDRSPAAREYRKRQDSLLTTIRAIGKTGDITLIFSAERDVLQNEIRHYANRSGIHDSLKTALHKIDHAAKMLPVAKDGEIGRSSCRARVRQDE